MKLTLASTAFQIFAAVGVLLLAGCGSIGPDQVRVNRTAYNEAVTETQEEELLLNLVRTRYLRSPSFLQVSSISSSATLGVDAGGTVGLGSGFAGNFGRANLVYLDEPTIIYQPVTGKELVRQLLTPLNLRSLSLLVNGGFSASKVFRVFIEQINGVPNARAATSVAPKAAPEFAGFSEVARLFDNLSARGQLLSGAGAGGLGDFRLFITPEGKQSEEGRALMGLLRLDPAAASYRAQRSEAPGGGDLLAVYTRSVAAAIQYLSKGVEAPAAHSGEIVEPKTGDGQPYDWSLLLGDVFQVKSSASEPSSAAIKVFYRDHWFFIDAHDIETKATFAMLSTVLRLQAGGDVAAEPVLTLSATGN